MQKKQVDLTNYLTSSRKISIEGITLSDQMRSVMRYANKPESFHAHNIPSKTFDVMMSIQEHHLCHRKMSMEIVSANTQ